jgi:hypothetical protein
MTTGSAKVTLSNLLTPDATNSPQTWEFYTFKDFYMKDKATFNQPTFTGHDLDNVAAN